MSLWSQSLDSVISSHPLYSLIAKGPLPAALGLIGGGGIVLRYDAVPFGILIGLVLIALPVLVTQFLDRSRIRFEITKTGAIRHQGDIEQSLPFGTAVDYTLTRGPIRRALNLPAVLRLNSQTGVMRSWSLTWPVAATEIPALDAALKTALGGKRT